MDDSIELFFFFWGWEVGGRGGGGMTMMIVMMVMMMAIKYGLVVDHPVADSQHERKRSREH